jgi:uncharacterized protein (TIGR03084 family)
MTKLEEIRTDLAAEHDALEGVLVRLADPQWDLPTHAPGWLVRDQISHLARFDETATLAVTDPVAFRTHAAGLLAGSAATDHEGLCLARGRAMTPSELLGWWRAASAAFVAASRSLDPAARLPWYGPSMSAASFLTARLMETWSHGLDVVDVVGLPRPDTDRLRHVVFIGVRTREFSHTNRGLAPDPTPVSLELTGPSGTVWSHGDPGAVNRIVGPARDFCRVVTQRRHVADTDLHVTGPAAAEWMRLAQAFAGPPGPGRRPGEFPREGAP